MASSVQTQPPSAGQTLLPPTLMLAGQRARKTWSLLLLIELGLLGAVLLACVVPLYTNITLTAALRTMLNGQDSALVVSTTPRLLSASIIAQAGQMLNKEITRTLGTDVDVMQFAIHTQQLPLLSAGPHGSLQAVPADMNLVSADLKQATAHLKLVAGHLPDPANPELEVALTPTTAQALHVNIGDTLYMHVDFTDVYTTIYSQILKLHLSGLFTPDANDASFWHGNDFAPSYQQGTHFYALMPDETLLNTFTSFSNAAGTQHHVFASPPTVLWYYHFNSAHLTINDLNAFFSGIQQVQFDNANNSNLQQDPYLLQTQTFLSLPDTLNGLVQRATVIAGRCLRDAIRAR
ncbi:MAG TPA: hypothetical protein VGD98_06350 [Ktedonobacteraceae bacterium]